MVIQPNIPLGNSVDNRILSWLKKDHKHTSDEICSWSSPRPQHDDYRMNWVDPDPDPVPTSVKNEVLPIIALVIATIVIAAICALCVFALPALLAFLDGPSGLSGYSTLSV